MYWLRINVNMFMCQLHLYFVHCLRDVDNKNIYIMAYTGIIASHYCDYCVGNKIIVNDVLIFFLLQYTSKL